MNEALLVVLSAIDVVLDLVLVAGVFAVLCGWSLSAQARESLTEKPGPERKVTPAPTLFTVVRVDEAGNEVARFAEDARGAAKRVVSERKAGYSGHLLANGQRARSWVNGEDVVER